MVQPRLLQMLAPDGTRKLIFAQGGDAHFVTGAPDVRTLARQAIAAGKRLQDMAIQQRGEEAVDVRKCYEDGLLLPAIDHNDSARIMLAGTGLTHLGSAEGRDKMHRDMADASTQTDSMRMFLEGLEGGKPAKGEEGQQPEWFYKGDGQLLVGPRGDLTSPAFALDGSEEPELAGVYMIGDDGAPFRLGIALANEFSDHVTERHNYLWLAHSKLRPASLGAELLLGEPPADIRGTSRIWRGDDCLWEKPFLTGQANMSHTIANLEAHHFKYAGFRRPGDIHVHFFGTATLSFSDNIRTEAGDLFEIEADSFTLPLRNRLTIAEKSNVEVKSL